MNGFYLAKKSLKYSGYLDLAFMVGWSTLFLIISIHNVCSQNPSSFNGYLEYFKDTIFNFPVFELRTSHLVVTLFVLLVLTFVLKVVFGFFSLYWFFKSKNLMLLSASAFVIFLPLIGGIVAVNTYHATTSSLAPRYISPFSLLRSKIRVLISTWLGNADNQ